MKKADKLRRLGSQFDHLWKEDIRKKLMAMSKMLFEEGAFREDTPLMDDNFMLAKLIIMVWSETDIYPYMNELYRREFLNIRSWTK